MGGPLSSPPPEVDPLDEDEDDDVDDDDPLVPRSGGTGPTSFSVLKESAPVSALHATTATATSSESSARGDGAVRTEWAHEREYQ
jgi:hypothetical protein